MRRYMLFFSALFLLSAISFSQNLVKVGDGYGGTSVNATIFRNNSLVSYKGHQYISYYDNDGYVVLGKRSVNSNKWELSRSQYKGKISDAHNVISMMVDGDGFIHLSFDHHGNKLNYCRSVAPESLQLGDKEPMTGVDEQDVTYPEFYMLPSGDLLFAYRSGCSGRGNLVLNKYDLKSRRWHRLQDILIDGENTRNAYWQMCVDKTGYIHLSWVWRETYNVETNHDLCYACSKDGGITWHKSDGTKYTLPITASNAEYAWHIPQSHELINQTSMSADEYGNPYIATYWRDENDSVPQYRIVWNKDGKWYSSAVSNRKTPFSLSGGGTKMIPMSRPRMVVDGENVYYMFRDEERGSKASLAFKKNINDENETWKLTDITSFSLNAWEPSYDSELWKNKKKLHVFIQKVNQGDGERKVDTAPTMVYVLELNNIKKIEK